MKFTRRGFAAAAAGIAMLTIVSCTSQAPSGEEASSSAEPADASGNASGNEVNVYSSRHYDSDQTLYESFTEETGIQVNVIEGKDDELIERIKSEGTNSPADVLITVDAGRLWRAEQEGILQPAASSTLEAEIPENLRHPDGLWYGLTRRARVIVYNKAEVNPSELSTYEALAEPEWQGRVCIRSSSNVYNQSLLGSMVETLGADTTEAWAKGLVGNLAREPEGGDTDQINAVAAGQCDVAIVNHYYWARLASSDDSAEQDVANQVGVFFPNQDDRGTHVNISGAGVAVNAPHPENAIAFIEYLASPEAQQVFAQGSLEYPVVEGVAADPTIAALGDFKSDSVNVGAYGRNNPAVVQIADRVGWK